MTEALTAEGMKDQGYLWCDGCDDDLSMFFEADSPEEAAEQMAAWAVDLPLKEKESADG